MDNINPEPPEAPRRPAPEPGTADPAEQLAPHAAPSPISSPPTELPEYAVPPPHPTPPLFPYATTAPQPPNPVSAPRRSWWIPLAAGTAGAAVLSAVLWAGGVFDEPVPAAVETATGPREVVEIREVITPSDDQTSSTAVARKVVPSIVTVDVGTDSNGAFDRFGSGSGVVLREDGLIVTNQHVIEDADRVQVIFSDGRIYEAEIIGADRRTDLAVLQISAAELIPIGIGSTESAEIGQVAIAVGSPLGLEGGPSLTVGVISAFGRQVRTGSGDTDILFDMLQTDAPITQGSSGGALVDAEGRLLGITSAIGVSSAGAEGIGFAIPIELVQRITDEIIATGSVRHAFLGVSLGNAFEEEPDGAQAPAGALVIDFATSPSAAESAGLEPGDVIVGYDSNRVDVPDDLISGLRRLRAGDEVTLNIVRGTEQLEIEVTLGVRPADM